MLIPSRKHIYEAATHIRATNGRPYFLYYYSSKSSFSFLDLLINQIPNPIKDIGKILLLNP